MADITLDQMFALASRLPRAQRAEQKAASKAAREAAADAPDHFLVGRHGGGVPGERLVDAPADVGRDELLRGQEVRQDAGEHAGAAEREQDLVVPGRHAAGEREHADRGQRERGPAVPRAVGVPVGLAEPFVLGLEHPRTTAGVTGEVPQVSKTGPCCPPCPAA